MLEQRGGGSKFFVTGLLNLGGARQVQCRRRIRGVASNDVHYLELEN